MARKIKASELKCEASKIMQEVDELLREVIKDSAVKRATKYSFNCWAVARIEDIATVYNTKYQRRIN